MGELCVCFFVCLQPRGSMCMNMLVCRQQVKKFQLSHHLIVLGLSFSSVTLFPELCIVVLSTMSWKSCSVNNVGSTDADL